MEHLQSVLNDPDVAPSRKDRVAVSLLNVLMRQGGLSKRALAEKASREAGWQTPWYALLHSDTDPNFDPAGLTPEDRLKWEAKQRAKAQTKPAQDTTNWDRYLKDDDEPKQKPCLPWGDCTDPETGESDPAFNPRRYRFPPPPDDE